MSKDTNQQQLLRDCVQIRGLLTRLKQSPKLVLVDGTKEAEAIKNALDMMDKRLLDGHNKSKSLAGKGRKTEITANSTAVSKIRGKKRKHLHTMVDAYLRIAEKE